MIVSTVTKVFPLSPDVTFKYSVEHFKTGFSIDARLLAIRHKVVEHHEVPFCVGAEFTRPVRGETLLVSISILGVDGFGVAEFLPQFIVR